MKEMKFIQDGHRHREGEIIVFPSGEYRIIQGAVLKRVVTQRSLLSGEYESTCLYGNGDVITVEEKSQAYDYKCMNFVTMERVKKDENLDLLRQLRKQEDLCCAVAKRRSHNISGVEEDIRENKVYCILQWIDKYFRDQTFSISHAEIGSLCVLSRGSITVTLNRFYNLGLIENSRIKKIREINLIK